MRQPDGLTDDDHARAIFELLDLGVALLASPLGPVLVANKAGEEALAKLGVFVGSRVEGPLATAVENALAREHLTGVRVARAVSLTAQSGARFFLTARTVDAHQVLVTISRSFARARELGELLQERFGLSPRECEIVVYVRDGYRSREIADAMQVSVPTVKKALTRIYEVLEVKNRTQLIRLVADASRG